MLRACRPMPYASQCLRLQLPRDSRAHQASACTVDTPIASGCLHAQTRVSQINADLPNAQWLTLNLLGTHAQAGGGDFPRQIAV